MGKVRLTEAMILRIVDLRRQGKSYRNIARELGVNAGTAARYGASFDRVNGPGHPPPDMPIGEVVDRTEVDGTIDLLRMDRPATVEELMRICKLDPRKWVPTYFKPNVWQGYGKLKGSGTERFEKVNLYQSKLTCKRILTEEFEDAIRRFVRELVPAKPKPKHVRKAREGFMVAWGMWDTHIGSYAWNSETNNDWDVDRATRRIFNSIDDMVDELKLHQIERIVMPIGNDFMHFDSVRMKTTHGEHVLDTDTRFARVYLAALRCLSYMVERAVDLCPRFEGYYVPGNHDATSSYTLCVALAQRFRNDPRVQFDLRANPRKYVTHGGTILGFDHGNDASPQQLAMIMSSEPTAKDAWSKSTYREVQVGDKHQRWERNYDGVVPTNGVLVRRNPSLCNVDAWHHYKGLVGEAMKSVEAWRYDRIGYRGSHVTWARDDEHAGARAALEPCREIVQQDDDARLCEFCGSPITSSKCDAKRFCSQRCYWESMRKGKSG